MRMKTPKGSDMENLVQIPGYRDYFITDNGRVWSNKSGRFLSVFRSGVGQYPSVGLGYHGTKLISRLLAMTFLPNPENKPWVIHKDGNDKNNVLSNLEWSDSRENQIRSYKRGKRSPCYGKTKKILATSLETGITMRFPSLRSACRYFGLEKQTGVISETARGKHPYSHGYLWEYLPSKS